MKFYQPQDYQSHCKKLFEHYKEKISQVLPHAQIEHIGASTIPGCISKGDLDIYVALDFMQHKESINKIEKLGFKIKTDTFRTEELCMLESIKKDDVAIQLVVKASENEMFLDFKKALLKDTTLVEAYNHMKLSCTGRSQKQYREIKSQFIEKVLNNEKI